MSHGLVALLGKDLGEISMSNDGNDFAKAVIAAAHKHHIPLQAIDELKYADLNGDGKIESTEIAALISAAHEKRTGSEFQIVSSGTGRIDGRSVKNPDFDPAITAVDLVAMTDPAVIKQAKQQCAINRGIPTVEELLHAIDKQTMGVLKGIRGGIEVNEHTGSAPINGSVDRQNGFSRYS